MRWPSLPMLLLSGCVGLSPRRCIVEEGQQCTHHERKGLQNGATASVDK
jgi:hypothetical protein